MAEADRTMTVLPPRARTSMHDAGVLTLRAPAKINLDLRVGPRREDGFHGIDSLVVKVTLYDELHLAARGDGRLTFACDGADCGPDERNLTCRAAELLRRRRPAGGGADIRLSKHIPPSAGLGGGSSDAAATLMGLNALWELGLSHAELSALGAELGSDVPLFLNGPACRITGRGEQVEQVDLRDFPVVLVLPELTCPTEEVYRAFDAGGSSPPPSRTPVAVGDDPPSRWRESLVNDLAAPAQRVCPALGHLRGRIAARLEQPVCVSGSGSALFVPCDDTTEARAVWGELDDDVAARSVLVRRNPW
ncbi:MAG: 4-(cytidine 5'-diphospho)-2-C-methyl-D-erythritol kinase [Planctomycetota bacterium]